LEKLVRSGLLYDFYGGLLTEKQRKAMELYYFEDWSLAEIAESEGVSRQAVHDLIHRTERTMEELEAKLGLVGRFLTHQQVITEVTGDLERVIAATPKETQLYQDLRSINHKIAVLLKSELED
jgi:predicted DNA-binding protein YlxM (UPF0122 family)